MKLSLSLALAATISVPAFAQTVNCAAGQPCNPSLAETHLGDTSADSSAKGSVAITSKSGNAEAHGTAVGTEINPVLNQKGSITQQPTLTQTGGPQYSASGANADGSSKADATVGPIQVAPIGNSSIGKVGGDTKTGDNQLNNASKSSSSATNKTNNTSRGGDGGKGGDAAGGAATAQGGAATGGTGTGTSTAAASTGAQTQGSMNVDASQHSVSSTTANVDARALVMSSPTQQIAPGLTNSGQLIAIATGCGPRKQKFTTPIYATHVGFWGGSKQVLMGTKDDIRELDPQHPYDIQALPDGRMVYTGSAIYGAMGKIGISTNRGAQGGGQQGTNFAGVQAGFGSASASEAIDNSLLVVSCSFIVEAPAPPPAPMAAAPMVDEDQMRKDALAWALAHMPPPPPAKKPTHKVATAKKPCACTKAKPEVR